MMVVQDIQMIHREKYAFVLLIVDISFTKISVISAQSASFHSVIHLIVCRSGSKLLSLVVDNCNWFLVIYRRKQ